MEQRQVVAGQQACFLIQGETFQEINWFKPEYGSWFVGDMVIQGILGKLCLHRPVFLCSFRVASVIDVA